MNSFTNLRQLKRNPYPTPGWVRRGRERHIGAWMAVLAMLSLAAGMSQPVWASDDDSAAPRPISGATPTPQPAPIRRPDPATIGASVQGRPLQVYRFGTGANTRMIVADIHGGYEWNTAALAEDLIDFLAAHPGIVPPGVSLYVLPSMNPDGLAKSHGYDGRANANNVDLNRNFPLDWQATWAPEGCWNYLPITAGAHPLSEPESRAVARFVLSNSVEAMISYHSAALGIFAGGDPSTSRSISLAKALSAVSPYEYPPRNTGCEYAGEMVDWAAVNGVAAVDIELSTHYELDEDINLRVLYAFLNWQP